MDGRGGGCVTRYSTGGGFGEICYGSYGMSKVERIMLKYRPIAPKPMAAGSGSSCSTVEQSDASGKTRRRKRKYVRVNIKKKDMGTNSVSKKRKVSVSSGESSGVVTLSLMPETPDRKENSSNSCQTSSPSETRDLVSPAVNCKRLSPTSPILLSFNKIGDSQVTTSLSPPQSQKTIVTSFVTVECVTEAWVNSDRLGVTDQVQVMNMDTDTCPSFITNARDTVVWTNKAYRVMTAGKGADETTTVVVKKFNRVTMPESLPAFTCKVRVTWGTERAMSPLTVTAPCDVWRMRCGGYAWRLDVTAALSLGRYSL
ncbi:uncharacterized protein LOC143563400 [Bidens hawaiensis]|uniref:uncharacterized protein LOC143563400 n=1 Tax=Bidens hawaiensis TaxID=980011 RepID=UPI00404B78E9